MATPGIASQNSQLQQQIAAARARTHAGAGWFLWIAGLSVVNTLISMSGGSIRFIFGLGITTLIDAIGHGMSGGGQAVALAASVLGAAVLAIFGVLARKELKWAFLLGMILYVCDGLLLIPAKLYLDAAFHAWALFRLYQGFQALGVLQNLRAQEHMGNVGAVSASWEQR